MTLPPPVVRTRRLQLQISERRVLLMLGDTLAILVAVLLSLVIWLVVDGRRAGLHRLLWVEDRRKRLVIDFD